MTKIVVDKITICIPHIEVLISLGHWMIVWYMGNHMETFCHLVGLIYQDESVIVYVWPFCSYAMKISSF